jgi:hypothetical protein
LQRYRDEDKHEFLEFSSSVQNNFISIQNNFVSIQTNFEKLFTAKKVDAAEESGTLSASRQTLRSYSLLKRLMQLKSQDTHQILQNTKEKSLRLPSLTVCS